MKLSEIRLSNTVLALAGADGVMTDAEIIINGKPAGELHQGGFYRFSYDITELLNLGKKYQLEVIVAKE